MRTDKDVMVIERECGIEFERIATWAHEADLLGCTVELARMPGRRLGKSMTVPVTALRIEGPEREAPRLYRNFELAFMSAGG